MKYLIVGLITTAFNLFRELAAQWSPEKASAETGIPADTIVRIAREFFTQGGVCDDGWYSSRNGNDCEAYQLMSMINLFTGSLDREGGFVVTQGGGLKMPSASASGGKGKGPKGQTWETTKEKSLDKLVFPESSGTFASVFESVVEKKPYQVKAIFVTGSTMFHREANSDRMAKALKATELLVVQEILPHEVIDYADYVLPSTFFLEWHEYAGASGRWTATSRSTTRASTRPKGARRATRSGSSARSFAVRSPSAPPSAWGTTRRSTRSKSGRRGSTA